MDCEEIAMRVAEPASFRFASPKRTVCSCSTSGRRHRRAARPAGTATYPPVARTTSGLKSATSFLACATPRGTRAMSFMFAVDMILSGLLDRGSLPAATAPNTIPPAGAIRASRPSAVPIHGTSSVLPSPASRS